MTTNNTEKNVYKKARNFYHKPALMKLMALVEGCMDPMCFIEKRNL